MSYATVYIYCDKCNYTNKANIDPIDYFYKILIFNELHFKSTDGWCIHTPNRGYTRQNCRGHKHYRQRFSWFYK